MTDDEVLQHYVRVSSRSGTTLLEVCEITWDGPHTPFMAWRTAEALPENCSEEQLADAMARIAGEVRYFRRCVECGELKPCGHMQGEHICQGCAERNHGVVH